MSRKLVLVSVFLALLPVVLVAVKARSDDPSKNAGGTLQKPDDDDPFGDAGVAKANQSQQQSSSSGPRPSAAAKADEWKRPQKARVDIAQAKPASGPKLQGGEEAILKALKQETSLEFADAPLKDVVDYLIELHRIPIIMDSAALKEAGVERNTPITCNLSGIPLSSALAIVLDELQLKSVIHHNVLMITSPAKAEAEGDDFMLTKFYDVTDLLVIAKDHDLHDPLPPLQENDGDRPVYAPGCFPGMGMGGMGYGPQGDWGAVPVVGYAIPSPTSPGGGMGGMFAVAPEREPASPSATRGPAPRCPARPLLPPRSPREEIGRTFAPIFRAVRCTQIRRPLRSTRNRSWTP